MKSPRIVIVGAGIGGLASAIGLAQAGAQVTVFERGKTAGGKIRSAAREGLNLDVGPTVVTMPWVFEPLFHAAGTAMQQELTMQRVQVLAQHRWPDGSRLELFSDRLASMAACREFAGPAAASEYEAFMQRAQRVYELLEPTFMSQPQAGLTGFLRRCGIRQLPRLAEINPFQSLWTVLGAAFSDARLQQLFARYATYCGSSPFHCPSTLMLIAHVESLGVWRIDGGMRALAAALVRCAESMGVEFAYDVDVDSVVLERGNARGITSRCGLRETADAVVLNADTNAIAAGHFGAAVQHAVTGTEVRQRSLSAVTFAGRIGPRSNELQYHNVFFADNYQQEFAALAHDSVMPAQPTTYICAPDYAASNEQRLFVLVNAPANGDSVTYDSRMVDKIRMATTKQLQACGLAVDLDEFEVTTPNDFAKRYPGTGGALYGPAMHGWRAAFRRSGNATRIPGLFVAGGSVHPGSGVPMAATAGKLCAAEVLAGYSHRHKHLSRLSAARQNHAAR